jgi:hypothetical protein
LTIEREVVSKGKNVPGWTAPAMRSPAPERLSLAFWVVDFWESGVTLRLLDGALKLGVDSEHTLLGGLVTEALAHGVRHVDCWWVVD